MCCHHDVDGCAPHCIDLAILPPHSGACQTRAGIERHPPVRCQVFTGESARPADAHTKHSRSSLPINDNYVFRCWQTTVPSRRQRGGGSTTPRALIGIIPLWSVRRPTLPRGLGFSTALPPLLDLAPKRFGLPARNPERDPS